MAEAVQQLIERALTVGVFCVIAFVLLIVFVGLLISDVINVLVELVYLPLGRGRD